MFTPRFNAIINPKVCAKARIVHSQSSIRRMERYGIWLGIGFE
jgi:hypothetical protein